ncbi:hypothetical protein BDZ45DRAFT_742770 [Acephala macrosclerotiorum]|nr:hypothetical protein BDZ45DRAFT_742770 [Acephala macrosclerotiorum]
MISKEESWFPYMESAKVSTSELTRGPIESGRVPDTERETINSVTVYAVKRAIETVEDAGATHFGRWGEQEYKDAAGNEAGKERELFMNMEESKSCSTRCIYGPGIAEIEKETLRGKTCIRGGGRETFAELKEGLRATRLKRGLNIKRMEIRGGEEGHSLKVHSKNRGGISSGGTPCGGTSTVGGDSVKE